MSNLRRTLPGDIRYGYLHSNPIYIQTLSQPGWSTIFLYRDPRDMLVSHVFYATEMKPDHGMFRYYNEVLSSFEERLNAAIEGVRQPGFELSSVRDRYDSYLGWLTQPDILCLRFEDLILQRDVTLGLFLDFLGRKGFRSPKRRVETIESIKSTITPGKSGTFRKGQPGSWREHFTADNKNLFKTITGDLLIRLGYEQSNDW
jgi:hypothetical protein